MLRRAALAVSLAASVAACGHQVTPSPLSTSNLAGHMIVRFRTNGALNFNSYTYAIVIDACGAGMPYPNAYATTFNNYTYSFLIGGAYGVALPTLEQYIITPGTYGSLNPQTVPFNSSLVNFNPNSNSRNTEFTLTFDRALLNNPKQVAQPCPNITPSPSPSPSPSAAPTGSASPTPSPTPAGSASPTPSPSPSPSPSGAPVAQATTWYVNFFTISNPGNQVLDSLGVGGAQDTTFNQFTIDTTTTVQNVYDRPAGSTLPSDPAAQLAGGELDTYQ